MKRPILSVLALEHFFETNRPGSGYYIERLEDQLARFSAVSLLNFFFHSIRLSVLVYSTILRPSSFRTQFRSPRIREFA
jgi:hypothetical protein